MIQFQPLRSTLLCVALTWLCLCFPFPSKSVGQEVWEYSPYKVRLWLSVSPSLSLNEQSLQEINRKVAEYSDIHFGATWSTSVEATPDALFGTVLYRMDELTIDQLLSRELMLVVAKSDEAKQEFLKLNPPPPKKTVDKQLTKEQQEEQDNLAARDASLQGVRTLETAIEKMKSIAIHPLQYTAMQRDIVPFLDKKQWADFKSIVHPFEGSNSELESMLSKGQVLAALIEKQDVEKYRKVARQLPTRLPWQPESLLRSYDKIFMVSVDKAGESIRIRVKELDSLVRQMGEIATVDVISPKEIPRAIAQLARDTFSPVVRIEDSDYKTAVLRVKAAGLLTQERHPTRIGPGDVIVPIIRRDDSSGNPTLVQSIPYTFIAVTEKIDNTSRLFGAIFTASRGALAAAKNRRTQRIGLKVNPHFATSDLKLAVQRVPGSAVPGAEIYQRTPGHEDLRMVGRTDWRGILPIETTELPVIRYEPPNESKTVAIARARQLSLVSVDPPEYKDFDPQAASKKAPVTETSKTTSDSDVKDASADQTASALPDTKKALPAPKLRGSIQLNVPLYVYYIKNGETLLARLPIVTGFKPIDQADLPDDRRRLEVEGFLKGLQGEVLDLVVRRRILEFRIRKEIKSNHLVVAERLLDELKQVKSYDRMSEQIVGIQRRALSTDQGPVPMGVVKRIDKMIDTTRLMMQKYLQDSIVRDLEMELSKAK